MTTVKTERVLVIPTAVFHEAGKFQGFCGDWDHYEPRLMRTEHFSFRPRHEVEEDPSFKQLIPYVIFRYRDPSRGDLLFQYTRGSGQGEQRLHAKRSIGVGGHISEDDAGDARPGDAYAVGLQRELLEEVRLETRYSTACVGLINDDQTPVGQVHLGIVHLYDVEKPHVYPREVDLADAGFRPVDELLADVDAFETWSQYSLRELFM